MNRHEQRERASVSEMVTKMRKIEAKLAQMNAVIYLAEQSLSATAEQLTTARAERDAKSAENEELREENERLKRGDGPTTNPVRQP